jgi:hypothetical protein
VIFVQRVESQECAATNRFGLEREQLRCGLDRDHRKWKGGTGVRPLASFGVSRRKSLKQKASMESRESPPCFAPVGSLDRPFAGPHNSASSLLANGCTAITVPARKPATLFKNETADKCGRLMRAQPARGVSRRSAPACSNHKCSRKEEEEIIPMATSRCPRFQREESSTQNRTEEFDPGSD